MWTITVDGFYSVTAFDERRRGPRADAAELVMVRGRARDDLERLSRSVPHVEILATPRSDYPFRIICRRDEWSRYLVASVEEIDYLNFKDRVAERLGMRRHDVLLSVWAALRRLEEGQGISHRGAHPVSDGPQAPSST
jgi:hypothetical protein